MCLKLDILKVQSIHTSVVKGSAKELPYAVGLSLVAENPFLTFIRFVKTINM